ncbi:toprim domain-containing protein [Ornithinimicrobium sp. INDO-MA30-4]|uniref:toprim domain-containing protein n=1 Tax=Ornithinimicrobium sp. INDO-MA30-4 TaxID=2908651 RepID=UPI001F2BB09E|nr:toprim domain-containing protein [Ornithinimicrobium sp. INDO-MA30-4]UJH71731.1 toprim domain-containing protein [Ornithinimicrobium sp. INDO-MA30-4]
MRPGYAPAGWDNLVNHARGQGATDTELLESGLATMTRRGTLIDRFRDRAVFPIIHQDRILGFVGRRNPAHTDETPHAGPKYLNTPSTALFTKGNQLYGALPDLSRGDATPVLVEGPMDAHAITLATAGRYVGVAPLGTALTESQASQLAAYPQAPIIATDADLAGHVAAEKDHWLLAQHAILPSRAILAAGSDPSDLLERGGPDALLDALENPVASSQVLLRERLDNMPAETGLASAATVAASGDPTLWGEAAVAMATRFEVSDTQARTALLAAVKEWNTDPRQVVRDQISCSPDLRQRLEAQADLPPEQRWAGTATRIDARLTSAADWPALANLINQLHQEGHDVPRLLDDSIADNPHLGHTPAREMRYRLAAQASRTYQPCGNPPRRGIPTDLSPRFSHDRLTPPKDIGSGPTR